MVGDDWGEAPGEVAGWGGEEAVVDGWTLEAWAVGEVGRGGCLVGEAVGLALALMLVLGGVTSSTHSTLQLGAGVRLQGTNTLLLLLLPATCALTAAAALVVMATVALEVVVVMVEQQLACEGRSVPCSAFWLWRWRSTV